MDVRIELCYTKCYKLNSLQRPLQLYDIKKCEHLSRTTVCSGIINDRMYGILCSILWNLWPSELGTLFFLVDNQVLILLVSLDRIN